MVRRNEDEIVNEIVKYQRDRQTDRQRREEVRRIGRGGCSWW